MVPGLSRRPAASLMRPQLAGDLSAPCDVLKHYTTHIDAYNMPANLLALVLCPMQPGETIDYVRRMLRDGEWMSGITGKVVAAFNARRSPTIGGRRCLPPSRPCRRTHVEMGGHTRAGDTRIEAARTLGPMGMRPPPRVWRPSRCELTAGWPTRIRCIADPPLPRPTHRYSLPDFHLRPTLRKLDEAFKWLRQAGRACRTVRPPATGH